MILTCSEPAIFLESGIYITSIKNKVLDNKQADQYIFFTISEVKMFVDLKHVCHYNSYCLPEHDAKENVSEVEPQSFQLNWFRASV